MRNDPGVSTVFDLILRASRAICAGAEIPVDVGIRGGRITAVGPLGSLNAASSLVNLPDHLVLMPGLVDSHVHIGEPGHADWEGFSAATRGAAAGGVTTLVDMPLDSVPVTTSADALAVKREAAQGKCLVNVEFWGGVVPGNLDSLAELHAAGVRGFKCFLAESGSPDFAPLSAGELHAAMVTTAELGVPLLIHAESSLDLARSPVASGRSYQSFLASRPDVVELTAVHLVVATARRTGARAHVVHLSSAAALPILAQARADGVAVSAETCPHYLTLAAEDIADGATEFAACPPIRGRDNAERLWQGLVGGEIDLVASDHSPCAPELKHQDSGDFGRAWGGISSLQWSLPIMWSAARRRGIGLPELTRWMSFAPAALAGLPGKGRITVGADADLVAFDPVSSTLADPATWQHRHPLTPYAGRQLTGAVVRTWVGGRSVWPPDERSSQVPTSTSGRDGQDADTRR
jgi:allantoinase